MDYVKLSKEISYALLHHPEEFGIEPDDAGFVGIDELIAGINARHPTGEHVSLIDIKRAVLQSTKQRHEIYQGRIRALYGHSYHGRRDLKPVEPPAILYHGTSPRVLDAIMREGLRPIKRQMVHLSADLETALSVGSRHCRADEPVVLQVDATAAHAAGIEFYVGASQVWLCNWVPPQFLQVIDPV